jgi:hypothetical protein
MYEPLDEGRVAHGVETNQDRAHVVDSLLSEYLGPEKLKEKEQIADKIKFKRHQIDVVKQKIQRKDKPKQKAAIVKKRFNRPMKIDKTLTKKFADFQVMNDLWQQYMMGVLG